MTRKKFEKLIETGVLAIPEKFRKRIKNVAFLAEDEPSKSVRKHEGLSNDETLFGLYTGVPISARGGFYGVGPTMPDTITIYQKPIEEEAGENPKRICELVHETVWHEVAHYLGLDEDEVRKREKERGIKS